MARYSAARSAYLALGLCGLLDGDADDDRPLVTAFYAHGLIRGLYLQPRLDKGASSSAKRQTWPAFLRRAGRIPPTVIMGISDVFLLPSSIPSRTFAMTIMDILNTDKWNGIEPLINIENNLRSLRERSRETNLPGANKFAGAMLAMLADAALDAKPADKFRRNIEDWFNDAMERVSVWYKSYVQSSLIVICMALAVAFNVDSIRFVNAEWFKTEAPTEQKSPMNSDQAPLAAQSAENRYPGSERAYPRAAVPTSPSAVDLPIGWRYPASTYQYLITHPQEWRTAKTIEQIAGWMITALVLSQLSQLWFDGVSRLLPLRGSSKLRDAA